MSGSTLQYPYSAVSFVSTPDYDAPGYSYVGTGVLISPDEVLTAAHLVNDARSAADIQTRTGVNGSNSIQTASVTAASWFHAYGTADPSEQVITPDQVQNDYAIIHLSHPVSVGWMNYASGFYSGSVNITGYPAASDFKQVTVQAVVSKTSDYSILTGWSSQIGAGSSGSPLWTWANGPTVVGLISAGDASGNFYAMQITPNIQQMIATQVALDDATSPLVDNAWYAAHNPDVPAAGWNSAVHYDAYGWHEGRDPDPYFSTVGYLGANHDVQQAGLNPATHYDQFGWKEGRDPSADFDTRLYLMHNPDVARSGMDPLMHFLHYGEQEGRATYAAIGPAASIQAGFDAEYYLLANPDVAKSGMDAWTHFSTYGWKELRNPDAIFNTREYLAANPDVAAANFDPLLHYDQYGWKEGRDPSSTFDTKAYLSHYADVAAAGIDPLEHYLQYGVYQGRSTFPTG